MSAKWKIGALCVVGMLLSAAAAADPIGRAELIYQQRCANCHVLGHGAEVKQEHNKDVDLTLASKKHKQGWLQKWLRGPQAVNPETPCRADRLERHEIDLILQLLQTRARPELPVTVPSRTVGPIVPREPRRIQGPKAGGGG